MLQSEQSVLDKETHLGSHQACGRVYAIPILLNKTEFIQSNDPQDWAAYKRFRCNKKGNRDL